MLFGDDIMEIKSFLDICSGIGGGRLGLEQAGMHPTHLNKHICVFQKMLLKIIN